MKPYTLTRSTVRSLRGWHWCIDVTVGHRKSNVYASQPYRWRLQALWHLYMGAGWKRWLFCHRVYRDFQESGLL